MRRGFKTEAKALSEEIRAELGVSLHDPLDPRASHSTSRSRSGRSVTSLTTAPGSPTCSTEAENCSRR